MRVTNDYMASTYFSHDSNARNSKKLLRLRKRHGAAGYGVYFMLIEKLMETDDHTLDLDYDMLAFDLRVKKGFIKSVVENFGLFEFKVGEVRMNSDELQMKLDELRMNSDELRTARFFSSGLDERMELSKKRAEAGRKGMANRWKTASQTTTDEGVTENDTITNDNKNITNMITNDDFVNNTPVTSEITKGGNKKGVINNPQKERKYLINNPLFFMFSPFFDNKTPDGRTIHTDLGTLYCLVMERNMPHAEEELEQLMAYNTVRGQAWETMTPEQRKAAATLWQPRNDKAKGARFSKGFLDFWRKMVDVTIKSGDGGLIYQALCDGITEGVACREKIYELHVTYDLYDYIERHLDNYKDIVFEYIQSVGCNRLEYLIIDQD